MSRPLPIFEIQSQVMAAIQQGPVVVTAPTGSGKSTELPRWLSTKGKVLVIEPRRVACLGLCERVSFLEQDDIGQKVGYHVRAQSRFTANTAILFVTPGIALRYLASNRIAQFDAVILDEFHERSIETDLLLALLKKNFTGKLLVTSATIDARPLASYLNATPLHAEGTLFDVAVHYLGPKDALPSGDHLADRVSNAVHKAMSFTGDILVFLPGKSEIRRVADALASRNDIDVMQMHGDLGLGEQEQVFSNSPKRKVVLATNVCETSITVPGIGVVIDSGLVKRTRFVDDRGFLTLMPVALDSAAQRKGRAGRTAEGVCFRLWSERAVLEKFTPAEMFRESLTQMVLAAASCGERVETLQFYEAPKTYAVDAATQTLAALGAITETQEITQRGHALFGLPLRAEMAAFLVDAEKNDLLKEAIDVVSVAEISKELFVSPRRPDNPDDDFRLSGCDIRATLLAMKCDVCDAQRYEIHRGALKDAKKIQQELRDAFHIPRKAETDVFASPRLAELFIRTHAPSAHVARRKRGRLFFSNGNGKEITLSASSGISEEKVEAIVVFATVATGLGYREKDARIIVTMASPLKRAQLAAAGLGTLKVSNPHLVQGVVTAQVERSLAGCVLVSTEEVPTGIGAQDAIAELFLRGSIFKDALVQTRQHLAEADIAKKAVRFNVSDEPLALGVWEDAVPSPETWIRRTLSTIGIESGHDFALLSKADFIAPALPEWTAAWVRQRFPLLVNLGDAQYDVAYDFAGRTATLHKTGGTRKGPPSLNTVPGFCGFKIKVKHHTQTWVLRS
ncbi:MAG: ATP-dependent RNA helicase [Deltaproteobacteria bacterium]|nr:ATP-dependent RNA helicase [Deltaproteobacteria bacterium]MBN2673396.1 ATP-dependent RNA helicase [Deltaproteobacteria bacterium]